MFSKHLYFLWKTSSRCANRQIAQRSPIVITQLQQWSSSSQSFSILIPTLTVTLSHQCCFETNCQHHTSSIHIYFQPVFPEYLLFSRSVLSDSLRPHVTPWPAAHQASLSFTISWRVLKLMSIESVMPSNHLVLCHPLLLLPSIFSNIRVLFLKDKSSYYTKTYHSLI